MKLKLLIVILYLDGSKTPCNSKPIKLYDDDILDAVEGDQDVKDHLSEWNEILDTILI